MAADSKARSARWSRAEAKKLAASASRAARRSKFKARRRRPFTRSLLGSIVATVGAFAEDPSRVQIEQAEPRQARAIEKLALQELLFEHGELIGGHLTAVRFQLLIERAAGFE
jgi:hypothetical protein